MYRLGLLLLAGMLAGCRLGTAAPELEQLRARVSVLEAENAHLLGQSSLMESERDHLRQQIASLTTEMARQQAEQTTGTLRSVAASENLVVLPREVIAGQWVAVHIRNYPPRLLPQAGLALRGGDNTNLTRVTRLTTANVFLISVPRTALPGTYQIVLGESGPLGPGAKIDDSVSIRVRGP